MKYINKIDDVIGTFNVLNDKIIYSKLNDKSTRAIDVCDWSEKWIIKNKYLSINFIYHGFICDGSLSLFDHNTGELIFFDSSNLSFAYLVNRENMLFKQIIDKDVIWFLFNIDNFTLLELHKSLTGRGNAIYFDDERIIFRKGDIKCFNFKGEELWIYQIADSFSVGATSIFKNILYLPLHNQGISALDTNTGKVIWHKPINIDAFDEEKGLIYVLENDFIVIDATTGEEVIRVNDWSKKQLEKYPALFFGGSPCSLSEEYLVFSSRATFDEFGEGGVFFIDKETAEVKEYFRIVFDKDPVQRTGWSGNKIPDDQQIPFMPLDKPIYKNGRLYVLLPSPIEGQKDLYIYERE